MKTKTEAKRLAILKAAADVFRRMGFERASMSEIQKTVGGSKATLYNYFPSKERLFFEVMYQANEAQLAEVVGLLDDDAPDLRVALLDFGCQLLRFVYTPDAIAIRRLAIAEAAQSEIGKMCFERANVPTEKRVAEFLKRAMKRGELRTSDPKHAAIHLLALLESEYLLRILFGATTPPKAEALNAAARRAVDVFLNGYGKRS
ncbi:MAG: TetR/AcrR family transcriptional regulator C-terminal domain-containing protein [Proteobacteria bacterium]|nr:TetR/AcrR family transcriptional regulator C-terminal domain-containing protein [Pseudomonadota bacterium]